MLPGETVLSRGGDVDPRVGEFQVLSSPAGYYIGTMFKHSDNCCGDCGPQTWEEPNSRETDYFSARSKAEAALEAYKKTGNLPGMRY